MASSGTLRKVSSITCTSCWFCNTNSSHCKLSYSIFIFCSLRTWSAWLSLAHSSIVIPSCNTYNVSHGRCYRHFCALQHEAWNVNNLRDPKSLNMLFLPLEEQGQQTTALNISSPPENTKKQANSGSCQLLHWASALNVNCSTVYLRWMSTAKKATCAGRVWTCGRVIPQGVNAQEASKMTLGSGNSTGDE